MRSTGCWGTLSSISMATWLWAAKAGNHKFPERHGNKEIMRPPACLGPDLVMCVPPGSLSTLYVKFRCSWLGVPWIIARTDRGWATVVFTFDSIELENLEVAASLLHWESEWICQKRTGWVGLSGSSTRLQICTPIFITIRLETELAKQPQQLSGTSCYPSNELL